jgi:hypothetical protein
MIIHDFYIVSAVLPPKKADPPLIVDADAVLPCPQSPQFFQSISRRHPEIIQRLNPVQHPQFSERGAVNILGDFLCKTSQGYLFCLFTLE